MKTCLAIVSLLSLPLLTACESVNDGPTVVLASNQRPGGGISTAGYDLSIPYGVPGSELVNLGPPIRVLESRHKRCGSGRVHTLRLEEYVLRVLMCESRWSWPGNSLAAQAIAIRSFAEHYRCRGGAPIVAECADVLGDDQQQLMAVANGATQRNGHVTLDFLCVPNVLEPYHKYVDTVDPSSSWNRVVEAVRATLGLVVVTGETVKLTQFSAHSDVEHDNQKYPLNQDTLGQDVGRPDDFIRGLYGGDVRRIGEGVLCTPTLSVAQNEKPPKQTTNPEIKPVTIEQVKQVADYDTDYGSPDDGLDTATAQNGDADDSSYADNDESVVAWGDSAADDETRADSALIAEAAASSPPDRDTIERNWNAAGLAWYRAAAARRPVPGAYGTMGPSYYYAGKSSPSYAGGSWYGGAVQSLFPVSYDTPQLSAAAAAACYACTLETVPKGCSPIGCSETVGGACKPVGCVPSTTPDNDTGTCVPEPEQCNGKDDDCDGTPDNGTSMGVGIACSAQGVKGQCAVGQMVCEAGALKCQPASPSAETCDGLDNDCDDQVDNVQGGCTGQPGTDTSDKAEVCNGKDDNGDGFPDEDNPGGGGKCNLPPTGGQIVEGTLACVQGRLECITVAVPNADAQDTGNGGTTPVNSNQVEAAAWACSTTPGRSPAPPVALLLILLGLTLLRRTRHR